MMSIEGVLGFLREEYAKDPTATVRVSTLIQAITYNEGEETSNE